MQKFSNIRFFRVLACVGVFITHFAPRMGVSGWMAEAAGLGALGVYLFFLISGFLACGAKELAPQGGWRSILIYYCKRLFRILPLYYAVVLYNMAVHSLILKDVTIDPQGIGWLRYFFLTNAVIPAPDNFWGNQSGTWTISLFCFFYLCAPLFVRLIKGVKSAALLYLAALCLRCFWMQTGLSSYMMIFYYMHFFILGMLVRQLADSFPPLAATVRFLLFALAAGLALEVSGVGNEYFIMWSWAFAAAVLATGGMGRKKPADSGQREPSAGLWDRLKRGASAVLNTIDSYSYDIYLVHAVIFEGVVLIQGRMYLAPAAVLFLAVTLTAAGCFAANRLVEKPAEKLCARVVAALRI